MSATFQWPGTYGAAPGTSLDLGEDGNVFNFKSSDDLTDPTDYTTHTVTAGTNSYEVWIRGHFTGNFTRVLNLQFWKSSGGPDTGITIKWDGDGNENYVTPVATVSTIALTAVPTSDPGAANVTIGGDLDGVLLADGYSDYIVLQFQTTVDAADGDSSTYEFTLQYDES